MTQSLITLPGPDQLVAAWHDDLALRVAGHELTEATAASYRVGLRKLREWMHSVGETQITTDGIRQWKADLLSADYRPGSVNTWLAGVKSFTAWAKGRGVTPIDPAEAVEGATRRGANKRHSRQPFDDTEMQRLLARARSRPARRSATTTAASNSSRPASA